MHNAFSIYTFTVFFCFQVYTFPACCVNQIECVRLIKINSTNFELIRLKFLKSRPIQQHPTHQPPIPPPPTTERSIQATKSVLISTYKILQMNCSNIHKLTLTSMNFQFQYVVNKYKFEHQKLKQNLPYIWNMVRDRKENQIATESPIVM